MDSKKINNLRELEKLATPEPWMVSRDTFEPAIYTKLEDGCKGLPISRMAYLYCNHSMENAQLIAAMRNALPELLDAAEELQSLQDGMQIFDINADSIRELRQDLNGIVDSGSGDYELDELKVSVNALADTVRTAEMGKYLLGMYNRRKRDIEQLQADLTAKDKEISRLRDALKILEWQGDMSCSFCRSTNEIAKQALEVK